MIQLDENNLNTFDYLFQYHLKSINILQNKYNRMNSIISETTDLTDIYPQAKDQLQNKHTKLLANLQTQFSDLYDEFQPEKYIIVNAVAKVTDFGQSLNLSLALQQGITVLLSKTYKNESIFINGNYFEEELIFDSNGNHIDGIHEKINEIQKIINIVRRYKTQKCDIYGAILYIHSNVAEGYFQYQECFMLAVCLAILEIYCQLHSYTKDQICELLLQCSPHLNQQILHFLLRQYRANEVLIQKPIKIFYEQVTDRHIEIKSQSSIGTNQSIRNVDKGSNNLQYFQSSINSISSYESKQSSVFQLDFHDLKLAVCKLDISHNQLKDYRQKMNKVTILFQQYLKIKNHKNQIDPDNNESKYLLVHNARQIDLEPYFKKQLTLIEQLIDKKISFGEYLTKKCFIQFSYIPITQEISQLMDLVTKGISKFNQFAIIQGCYIIASIPKSNYAQVMCQMRKLVSNHNLSTQKFMAQDLKDRRNAKSIDVSSIIFTSSACKGFGIIDRQNTIFID